MAPRKAAITGILGQDGSILAESLLRQGFEVFGLVRKPKALPESLRGVKVLEMDIASSEAMNAFVADMQPQEFYHLAAKHHSSEVETTDELLSAMMSTNLLSTQVILEALANRAPQCRLLYSASSQIYSPTGKRTFVNENTRPQPSTYYGVTKLAAMEMVDFYQRKRSLFAVTAILFNHESTRRDPSYITRKISRAVARIRSGEKERLKVRDPFSEADWSSAEDITDAMQLMLRATCPASYVLSSGVPRTVKNILETAFSFAGLSWQEHTDYDATPSQGERPSLIGDSSRARSDLGWKPQVSFEAMIEAMVRHDSAELGVKL